MKDPVEGSLLVTLCPPPEGVPHNSARYSAIVMGVVSGPDITPQAVELHCTVRSKRCPAANQRVPVTVDRADPRRVVIEWHRMPVRNPLAQARRTAERQASALRHAGRR